jgi:hypothetical protein
LNGFEGWLVKINGKIFPNKYIHAGTYKCTPDQETDLDDETDADGIFHRNVLPAKATKIEFDIKPVRLNDLAKIKEIIPDNATEIDVEYWNDRKMQYQTGKAYIPVATFEPYMVYKDINDILYNPTRIAIIEYGEVRD